mmetsp:Transcript_2631/g.7554  ORF Transcript_2631/g.7554 Transcript_2631/m.7554 type:complete len:110 (-) Transcript_2631:28-357(-)
MVTSAVFSDNAVKPLCKHWAVGLRIYGDECRFPHDKQAAKNDGSTAKGGKGPAKPSPPAGKGQIGDGRGSVSAGKGRTGDGRGLAGKGSPGKFHYMHPSLIEIAPGVFV